MIRVGARGARSKAAADPRRPRWLRRGPVGVVLLSAILSWGVSARAQISSSEEPGDFDAAESETEENETEPPSDAELAKAAFSRGGTAYENKQFVQAARWFLEAHGHAPHSVALFNAGRAWYQAGEIERAADAYATALERGELDTEQSEKARNELARLRRKLGWIEVRGELGVRVSIGYLQDAELPLVTHLAPGDHVLSVISLDGDTWTQIVDVKADSPRSVYAKRPAPAPAPEPPPAPIVEKRGEGQKTWGIVTLTMGGALGVTAGLLGVATLDANDAYNEDGNTDPDQRSRVQQLKLSTNIAAFSAAALGGTGTVLLLTLPKDRRPGELTTGIRGVALGPQQVSLFGAF